MHTGSEHRRGWANAPRDLFVRPGLLGSSAVNIMGQGQWGTAGLDTVSKNDDIGSIRYAVEAGQDRFATEANDGGLPSWYRPHHYRFGHSRPELRPSI